MIIRQTHNYGEYTRVGRFGGWQAQWLASVIMMTGEGTGSNNGMKYQREIARPHVGTASAEIYTIGIVDIDEAWLIALIPDIKRRDKFLKGDQNGFFAE